VQSVRLADVVTALGGELSGDPQLVIDRIGTLESATPSTLSFLSQPKYQAQLATTRAGCVIVAPSMHSAAVARGAVIVTPDPYLYFARLTQWWVRRTRPAISQGIHPSAVVDPAAELGPGVSVGALAVIEAAAVIGEGAVIGAQCFVGHGERIGTSTRLAPHVTVGFDCVLGARCIVHSGVVIGADGFGFAPTEGRWVKIEQLGAVRIGDDVEIGANTCVDRGALDDTVIGDGVKLDNLIQIAHNVRIGAHTVMAGCVGVAGSAVIGAHCMIGGSAGIVGHIEIADNVTISAATVVTRSITKPGLYSGVFPFDDNASWEKNAATLRQLHALRERLRALEKRQA
jgi:UDP-3-O-[3-hydroxymyristoyl] glucosamine N-acyltransferase